MFRLRWPALVKMVAKDIRPPRELPGGFLSREQLKKLPADLTMLALRRSFGGNAWKIRSGGDFEAAAEQARGKLSENVYELQDTLLEWIAAFRRLRELIRRISLRDEAGGDAMLRQLEFMFRDGFANADEALLRYPRYFRGLSLRAERANSAPLKDAAKRAAVEPWEEKFYLAVAAVSELETAFDLCGFYLLLEEFRLASLAPEVRTLEKVTAARMAAEWEKVRL